MDINYTPYAMQVYFNWIRSEKL